MRRYFLTCPRLRCYISWFGAPSRFRVLHILWATPNVHKGLGGEMWHWRVKCVDLCWSTMVRPLMYDGPFDSCWLVWYPQMCNYCKKQSFRYQYIHLQSFRLCVVITIYKPLINFKNLENTFSRTHRLLYGHEKHCKCSLCRPYHCRFHHRITRFCNQENSATISTLHFSVITNTRLHQTLA